MPSGGSGVDRVHSYARDGRPAERGERLKPHWYYLASRAYRRAEVARARLRARAEAWQGVRILGYHRLVEDPRDVLAIHPDQFRRQMETLLASDAKPMRLDRALDLLESAVQGRYICVTFDDGYHDTLENGVPILQELGIPATIFLPSAIIDGAPCEWYRRPPRFLTWDEISDLVAGGLVDVQSETSTHPHLPRLNDRDARDEIFGSKREIERHVPYSLTSLCYPAGLYGERETRLLCEAGFRAGVTCEPGVNDGGGDLGRLRRTLIYWREPLSHFEAKIAGLLDRPSAVRALLQRRRAGA